ncbi:MAG TPA: ADOP family duplicated permease [Gemmatimonadaceae bacterium]|nr:ADOP family duplicated permease [Gemmatimonadaceae bacterium]
MLQDLRYAIRGLLRRPGLVTVTVVALTIGIAANAVMFGIVDQLLLSPPSGIDNASSLRRLYFQEPYQGKPFYSSASSFPMLLALREQVPAFADLAIIGSTQGHTGHGASATPINVQLVTPNFFSLLGVHLEKGRGFAPDEDVPPTGALVAVVSDGYWRVQLGSAPDVLGHTLDINGKPFTIIGVAPAGFSGVYTYRVDAWVPVSTLAAETYSADWYKTFNWVWAWSVVRMKPGIPDVLAQQQATSVFLAERERTGNKADSASRVVLGSMIPARRPNGTSDEARLSAWLLGVSLIVLLIACANVANLLIARTLQRKREIAVRLALGVTRVRLMRQLLTEAAVLAGVGAVVALVVSRWAAALVEHTLVPDMVWKESLVDHRVLAFTTVATVACVLLAGLAPAVQGTRTSVSEGLKSSARSVAGGAGRLRFALLSTQAALSLVLLVGAGLFVKSLRNVMGRDVGIDLDRVAHVTADVSRAQLSKTQIAELWRSAHERARRVPGVERATLVAGTVPLRSAQATNFDVPGVQQPNFEGGGPYLSMVDEEFFPTMGARIIRGRGLSQQDLRTGARIMVVNELLANAFWPGANPVGRCARLGNDQACTEIVGVVQTIMLFGMVGDDRAVAYLPLTHPAFVADAPPQAMLVRATHDASAIVVPLRAALQHGLPEEGFLSIGSFRDMVAPQLSTWRVGASMFTLFGAIALIIAAVGLYSVMAYWVSQRTQEIGVRMALGAQRGDVVRLVARQGSAALLVGVILGAAGAFVASRWVTGLLYETSPHDPIIYLGAAVVLAAAGVLATIVPARRSTKVDPAVALRAD